MFTYNEQARHFWFNWLSMESQSEFRLIGAVIGLAIYNGALMLLRHQSIWPPGPFSPYCCCFFVDLLRAEQVLQVMLLAREDDVR